MYTHHVPVYFQEVNIYDLHNFISYLWYWFSKIQNVYFNIRKDKLSERWYQTWVVYLIGKLDTEINCYIKGSLNIYYFF